MRDDQQIALGRKLAHAAGLGQPPDATDVRLHDVDAAAIHEVEKLEARRLPFARGDPDGRALGEPAVALEVVHPEWRLDEEHVVARPTSR